jgi:hypothetical protein
MISGQWTNEYGGVAASPGGGSLLQWNDANSTPIEDVRARSTEMQLDSGGFRPNKLVLGQQVEDAIVNHPDFVERVKYGGTNGNPAIVNRAAMAALFGVDEVLTMAGVKNTAAQGGTETNAFIGGKDALLLYAPNTAQFGLPTAGVLFDWTGYLGASPSGIRVSSFRMEELKSDRVEAEMAWDMKKTSADLGVFFNEIVA